MKSNYNPNLNLNDQKKSPTKEDLLKFGTFYKNDTNGNQIYQYFNNFYGIVGDKILKIRMK